MAIRGKLPPLPTKQAQMPVRQGLGSAPVGQPRMPVDYGALGPPRPIPGNPGFPAPTSMPSRPMAAPPPPPPPSRQPIPTRGLVAGLLTREGSLPNGMPPGFSNPVPPAGGLGSAGPRQAPVDPMFGRGPIPGNPGFPDPRTQAPSQVSPSSTIRSQGLLGETQSGPLPGLEKLARFQKGGAVKSKPAAAAAPVKKAAGGKVTAKPKVAMKKGGVIKKGKK